MERLKIAVLGWEPPSRRRVHTGAGMYLTYLTELGMFAKTKGRKLSLTFIAPSQCDRLVHREGYRVLFVRTPKFCERRPYDEDVLYPAAKRFVTRLLEKSGSVDLKKFDLVLANSFAFGELIDRAKPDNLVYVSHRPEFLREKLAERFEISMANKRRLSRDARLEAKSIEGSTRTITVSRACRQELARRFNRSRIDVIYNGVDTKLFNRVKCEANEKTVFTYAGRNHPEKGLYLLLQGARHAVDGGCSDFEIRLFTENSASLRHAVKHMHLSKHVKPMGWRRLRELPRLYSASTFTIMPSYWESFSYATVEGMACEVPAIVSNAGALPEIVNDKVGLVFRTGDERELALRIEEACSCDSERVAQMGCRGRRRIKRQFSKKAFLRNYLQYAERFVDNGQ
ncbi:MAG: glycosyltransferase family 4 protein [Methanobacteriota archaeon]